MDVESAELAGERASGREVQKPWSLRLAPQGALLVDDSGSHLFPAFPADVVRTQRALATPLTVDWPTRWRKASPVAEAVTLGNRVAAYSVAHAGAQTSMPTASAKSFLDVSPCLPQSRNGVT
jgi:sugar/nucleoside kinase (ribokinase family)